ncbi:hypothetical protein HanIR_Chr07g0304911 [Helianthus annuus]|nr:hypothetical protein HanIR_Chr07g0304911 [Helianthus annuus]
MRPFEASHASVTHPMRCRLIPCIRDSSHASVSHPMHPIFVLAASSIHASI